MKNLTGRVALITGGLSGIGYAIAERYVSEDAAVMLVDLVDPSDPKVAATLDRLGAKATYVKVDVRREEDWQAAERAVRAQHGRLDILVNNAGIDCVGAVETLELSRWRNIMSVNVDGVFLGTKTVTPLLAETGKTTRFGSSVINVSSIMGLVGYSDCSAYNASKGAVRLFTKAIAIEFATKRMPIRANSIHPGFVHTPLLHTGMQRWVDQGFFKTTQEIIDRLAVATPNGRLADPSEVAGVAYFLASDDSSYVTGSELVVDGGWTAQ